MQRATTSNPTANQRIRSEWPDMDDRAWEVIVRRYGFSEPETLVEVGERFSLTRERIRQIEKRAIRKIRADLDTVPNLVGLAAKHLPTPEKPHPKADTEGLLRALRKLWPGERVLEPWISCDAFLIGLRSIGAHSAESEAKSALPSALVNSACLLFPVVRQNRVAAARQAAYKKEIVRVGRNTPYRELLIEILQQQGHPMHYRDLARLVEESGQRRSSSISGVHNALGHSPEVFVLVDAGTFGLAEWGLSRVRYIPDIIADLLLAAGQPQSEGYLIHGVDRLRPGKSQSVSLYLQLSERFYRSSDGTYGLRAWLPPRHKQTLKTPSSLVEPKDSFARVERAIKQGRDVEKLIAKDKAKLGERAPT